MDAATGPNLHGNAWPAEKTARFRELFNTGISHSQIGAAMGITRNASIGKAGRLGLNRPPSMQRKSEPEPAPPKPWNHLGISERTYYRRQKTGQPVEARSYRRKSALLAEIPESEPVELVIPHQQRCSFLELNNDRCRWPIGEPGHPDFFFCGGKPVEALPYCGYHCRVAYNVNSGRRRASPGTTFRF